LDCNASFYGEVVTIYEPLACRREHDGNDSLQNVADHTRFAKAARDCQRELDYLAQRCWELGIPFDAAAARNSSLWLLECRLAITKLAPENDPLRAATTTILCHGVKLWFVSVALSPRPLARRLIALRFLVGQRPRWFALLAKLTKVKISPWRDSPRGQETNR
jgi:hypothetical protein